MGSTAVPRGFAELAQKHTDRQLGGLYGWPKYKIRYWRRKLNISGGHVEGRRKFTRVVRDFIVRNWHEHGPTEIARQLSESEEFAGDYSRSGVSGVARAEGLALKRDPSQRMVREALPKVRWRCPQGQLHEGGWPHCSCRG